GFCADIGHASSREQIVYHLCWFCKISCATIKRSGGAIRCAFCDGSTVRIIAVYAGMSETGAAPNRHRPVSTNSKERTEMDQTELNKFGNRYAKAWSGDPESV